MNRHWIDWRQPLLPAAAEWLVDRYAVPGRMASCAMERVACVLPGRRGGRVLLAELARRCEQRGLHLRPPRCVTPGALVELSLAPGGPAASPWERSLAWVKVLRGAPRAILAPVLPHPPETNDFAAWLRVARMLDGLDQELALHGRRFEDAATETDRLGMDGEVPRWRALEALGRRQQKLLERAGLVGPAEAWGRASEAGGADELDALILVGVAELARGPRDVVRRFGDRAEAIVHAPSDEAAAFDEEGCVIPGAWTGRPLSLHEDAVRFVDRPTDEAYAALEAIAAHDGRYAADEIIIGVADGDLNAVMQRVARGAGLEVHVAAGAPLARTAPCRLLSLLADWLEDPRFEHLAALLRHRDLDRALTRRIGRTAPSAMADFPALLDRYFSEHLHERPDGTWLPDPASVSDDKARQRIAETHARLDALWSALGWLHERLDDRSRRLSTWAPRVLDVLTRAYGALPVEPRSARDQATVAACLRLRGIIGELAEADRAVQPTCRAVAALRAVVDAASREAIAPEPRRDVVEALGWLELHLDPAPALVLLGAHEGCLPEAVGGDPFLPDALRRRLGLPDDVQRHARDAYMLEAMVRSRRDVSIIAARHTMRGDPMTPSRLLFAVGDDVLLRRVDALAPERPGPAPVRIGVPAAGSASAFVVPDLPPDLPVRASMSVTEFRSYLACPYRYALSHVLGLERRVDDARELTPASFGILAHTVLERFGRPDQPATVAESADPQVLAAHLSRLLVDVLRETFGPRPGPTVRVQASRLEQRLAGFARLEARQRRAGWRTRHVEWWLPKETTIDVDGAPPMPLRGKIDRIDHHAETGRWRVIDYKTGDGGADPHLVHNGTRKPPERGALEWKDLQLPLYHHGLRQAGFEGPIELGFIALPRKASDVDLHLATWTDGQLEEALEIARGVVNDVRARRFERAAEAPRWDDYARICQTTVFAEPEGGAA